MGCWNGTCGVSNLPIHHGDKVRGILIVGNASALGGGCLGMEGPAFRDKDWVPTPETEDYSKKKTPEEHRLERQASRWQEGWWSGICDEIFHPRMVPLRGEYDDYGGIENLKGLAPKVVMAQFQTDLMEFPAGLFDIPAEIRKDMPIKDLLRAIERNAVTVTGPVYGSAPVGLWMVLEEVYQAMVDVEIEDRWSDRIYSKKKFHDQIPKYLEGLNQMAESDRHDAELEKPENAAIKKTIDDVMGDIALNELRKMSLDLCGFGGALKPHVLMGTGLNFVSKYLCAEFAANRLEADSPEVRELVSDLADFIQFNFSMRSMRKGYMPQPGAGSQNSDMDVHFAVAEATAKFVMAYEKKWAEENEE